MRKHLQILSAQIAFYWSPPCRLLLLSVAFSLLVLSLTTVPEAYAQEEYLNLGAYQHHLKCAKNDHQRASALLSIGFHFLLKRGERVNDLKAARAYCDAADKMARRLESDSLEAKALFLSSQIQRESNSRAQALETLNKAIAKYGEAGDIVGHGQALMEKRHYFQLSGPEMQTRVAVVKEALELFKKASDKRLQGDALLELGDVVGNDGNLVDAISYLKQAAYAYKQAKFDQTQYLYSTLSIAHTVLGIYQEGLKYGFEAERVALALGDSSQTLCTIYNRIGMTYYFLGESNNALEFFRKGLAVAVRNKDQDGIVYLTGNIINKVLISNKSLVRSMLPELDKIVTSGSNKIFKPVTYSEICRTYLLVGNAERAKFFLDKLLEFKQSRALSANEDIIIYRAAFEYFFYTKDFRRARDYIKKEEVLVVHSGEPRRMFPVYKGLYKLDSIDGNFVSAFENLKKFKTYSDSSAAQMARAELQNLTVRYQVEKKNDEIKLKSDNIKLLTKDNRAQKALLQRAATIRNVTIAAIVLLILLLAALYSRWTANRRNNALIASKNARLEQLVREKEWLVKEIHHRVKNNLQTIISLLETQAAFLHDDALSAVMDSQHRIHAMSLIHQKLYQVDGSRTIDMQSYIEELVRYLVDSLDSGRKVALALDISSLELDVSRAIPVGLIINEAVTNSMKYAFEDRPTGMLQISLKILPEQQVELKIADDGVGLPPSLDQIRPASLGMRLMRGLAQEINGEISIDGSNGTSVSLTFDAKESVLRAIAEPA